MGAGNVPAGPVRVTPDTVATWIATEITICEIEATGAMARGDEEGALGMLARASGLGDAHALITGACRTCGAHVGQHHKAPHCRSGCVAVGGRTDVDPTYCAGVAPPGTFGSFEDMVRATGGAL
jgi:hypothetical protein